MNTKIWNVAIVGGGPAGLSAAINAASELPGVVLIESGKRNQDTGAREYVLGGQARGSTLIENYPGFPKGISGPELIANFEHQARRMNAEILCPERAESIQYRADGCKEIRTKEGRLIIARAVILANGLSYKKHTAEGVDAFLGKGVLYGAPTNSPFVFGACKVCIVGGANSAGQAAMHFAQNPRCSVTMLIRGNKKLGDQMSDYLVRRILQQPNITVLSNASVEKVSGTGRLEQLTLRRKDSVESYPTDHVFIFIGAEPKTEWLSGVLELDERNFIKTGVELGDRLAYETSMPGVFAIGDVRLKSVKRVASGCGEGSAVMSSVHEYLSSDRAPKDVAAPELVNA